MGMKPAQIELAIDELILDARAVGALSARAQQALRAEIERQLTHLLSASDAPAQLQRSGEIEAMDAGRLAHSHISPTGGMEQLGAQIAQAVYRSLNR